MTIRLAATAYRLPPAVESVDAVVAREHARVAEAMCALTPDLRQRLATGLGLERVHVCESDDEPYGLVREAALEAIGRAGVRGQDIDLVIDYSTIPGKPAASGPHAHRLSADLGAQAVSVNLAFAGCAGFHVAVKVALAFMRTDRHLRTAVLVAGDTPPPGSRSLLPITVQGDAGSAVVLVRDGDAGPALVDAQVITLGQLRGLITLRSNGEGHEVLQVDAAGLEQSLMPIYYLYFHRLLGRLLPEVNVPLDAIDHVIYANISASDRDGFVRALGFDPSRVCTILMRECGHTFASDAVLNYTELDRSGAIRPGQWLLFAGAGIGFTWGATLARA
jgi:3-oxoacyl-[acyl-carrier-protein] synthase-3